MAWCIANYGKMQWVVGWWPLYRQNIGDTLLVAIQDKEEKTLFMNAGGIQPTSILKAGFFESPQFENIANDDLFRDKRKNRAAVDVALGPLIRKQK